MTVHVMTTLLCRTSWTWA